MGTIGPQLYFGRPDERTLHVGAAGFSRDNPRDEHDSQETNAGHR